MKGRNGCLFLIFVVGLIVLLWLLWPKHPGEPPSLSPPTTPSSLTTGVPTAYPIITPSPTGSLTPFVTAPSSTPAPCNLKYPPFPADWESSYVAEKPISLRDLYAQKYRMGARDYTDLYAIVYYNNRKSLENSSSPYHAIDPIKLKVEKDWLVFIPPPTWIEQYRTFPMPVLKAKDSNIANSTIYISGSSLLYPLSLQISNCFENTTNFHVSLNSNNTKRGLFDYCRGVANVFGANVNDLSGELLNEDRCQGVSFYRFEVARYPVVIFANSTNPYVDDLIDHPLDKEGLSKLLFSATLWSDVRISWGDEPIKRYFPPAGSGIFETVKNEVFPAWDLKSGIPNLDEIEDDKQLINQVAADNFAIGFSGYVNYQTDRENLRAIPIENIAPNLDTISGDNPRYPLSQPLYLYTGTTTYSATPLLKYFINYYLTYEFDYLDELGYFKPNKRDFLNNLDTIP